MQPPLSTAYPPQRFGDVSSITSSEPNDRTAKQSDAGSDTSEHSMLLTTPPNTPWLLHRHRYFEECSRLTSRLALCVLLAALVLFSVGLVNVTEVPRRGDAAHNGRPRTRPSFFPARWTRNSSAEPQGASHGPGHSRPLPPGAAVVSTSATTTTTPGAPPPPLPPFPRSPPLRLLPTPTVVSECAHTMRPLEMAHEPAYPGRRHWRAYAEVSLTLTLTLTLTLKPYP